MKLNSLLQFTRLREALQHEREQVQSRLAAINSALGEVTQTQSAPHSSYKPSKQSSSRATGPRSGSLKSHVLTVLEAGPLTKEEVLEAVQRAGFTFNTSNPLNSLGAVLYGKNPTFSRVDGKFAAPGSAARNSTNAKVATKSGKRTMSAEGRARIAASARLRWKKAKAAGKKTL